MQEKANLFLFVVSAVYGSITWKEPEITVKKGEIVDITCSVKNVDEFDVVMVNKLLNSKSI